MEPVSPPKSGKAGVGDRRVPAWLCVAINQLAFPGLGTILAGHRVGYVQAVIMVAGFILTMGYLLIYLGAVVRYLQNPSWPEAEFHAAYRPHLWAFYVGSALCAAAWIWALISSRAIRREFDASRPPSPTSKG